MTPLLGIENDRANWRFEALTDADAALLWRTDGADQHVAVCLLNGWCVGLYQGIHAGTTGTLRCGACGAEHPDDYLDDGEPRCRECGARGEPANLEVDELGPRLAVPIQVALAVDPADVAGLVEQYQRTAESIVEP